MTALLRDPAIIGPLSAALASGVTYFLARRQYEANITAKLALAAKDEADAAKTETEAEAAHIAGLNNSIKLLTERVSKLEAHSYALRDAFEWLCEASDPALAVEARAIFSKKLAYYQGQGH